MDIAGIVITVATLIIILAGILWLIINNKKEPSQNSIESKESNDKKQEDILDGSYYGKYLKLKNIKRIRDINVEEVIKCFGKPTFTYTNKYDYSSVMEWYIIDYEYNYCIEDCFIYVYLDYNKCVTAMKREGRIFDKAKGKVRFSHFK